MKNKKIVLLIAIAVAVIVVIAGVFAMSGEVVETKTTEVVTVTDAPQTGEDAATVAETEEEEHFEIVDVSGTITEITDDYVMIDAGEMGMIQANLSDDTLIEGVDELVVGQTAVILYDGKMTRSLPAQITALKIGVYEVKGTVTEVADGRVTITKTDGGDEVVLTLPEGAAEIAVGDTITAYTTGVATMSLPPQMNAISIVK